MLTNVLNNLKKGSYRFVQSTEYGLFGKAKYSYLIDPGFTLVTYTGNDFTLYDVPPEGGWFDATIIPTTKADDLLFKEAIEEGIKAKLARYEHMRLHPTQKKQQEMTTMSVRLPVDQYEKLAKEAAKVGLTVSEAIRQLIQQLDT